MNCVNKRSSFNFDEFAWPPDGELYPGRFVTDCEHIASGSCRAAYLGTDTQTKQPVVIKQFVADHVDSRKLDRYWSEDIEASRVAQNFSNKYNEYMNTSKPIYFIIPIVHHCSNNIGQPFKSCERVLIEPYLGDSYEKFNTNHGMIIQSSTQGFSMPTLSHFSYHISGGQYLLCDLQGIKKSGRYILTDPVICSLTEQFGLTDLGEDGIRSFFANHKCTPLCEISWLKHPSPQQYPHNITLHGTLFRF
ncbi:unnamed protein product [Rotaria magnacalcarata]|uniref:Alpha-type protein kinase domain-containing protein n=1 Tax=Rotaria magnacalcarata TaxID=392030 RepID=A0A816R549_9BILA|nr:unnamed protein product [Rotaria magnacalcarata]